MKYSKIALKLVAAKESGLIKTNTQFWKHFIFPDKINEILESDEVNRIYEDLEVKLENLEEGSDYSEGIVCAYDKDFPFINPNVKNMSEKPYLLFYKGDLSLLKNLNENVAVIGLTDIDDTIKKRESSIIRKLVEKNLVIVSGLAQGCDTIAHQECLNNFGKTIAILPTSLKRIYPAENKELVNKILETGGLIISEYYSEAKSKFEGVSRFVERDRLQAMFSKAIILIASYRKDEGDSGSRHAMEAAKKYNIERFAMYNSKIDRDNKKFGLNRDYVENKNENVKVLFSKSIEDIKNIKNMDLIDNKEEKISVEQMKLM